MCQTCCQSYRSPFIVITIYGVACVQLAYSSLGSWEDIYSSCYYHNQLGSINFNHCYHFYRGWVPEKFVNHIVPLLHIYIPWKPWFFLFIIVQFMMNANSRMRFGLQIVFACLYITPSQYHPCPNLSGNIERIKWLSDIYLSSVWVRLSIFSQLSIIQYMGLCVFRLLIPLMMIEIIYTLSYYHH